jgi:hypothetical protein
MYIVIFAVIAYIPNFFQEKEDKVIIQGIPQTKVDSLLHIADKVEKKVDKSLMNKISNKNSENDSLKQVIKRKDAQIKKYKKLLNIK